MGIFNQDGQNVQKNQVTIVSQAALSGLNLISGKGNFIESYHFTPDPITIVEPVTVQECKDFSHVDLNDDDDKIESLIIYARKQIERYTMLSLIPVNVNAKVRNPNGGIKLPGGNAKDDQGDLIDTSENWFDVREMEYTAGWDKDSLPDIFKIAIKVIVDDFLNGKLKMSDDVKDMLTTANY